MVQSRLSTSFYKDFFFLFLNYVSVHAWIYHKHMSVMWGYPWGPEESISSPGAGVICSYGLPAVSPGNRTGFLGRAANSLIHGAIASAPDPTHPCSLVLLQSFSGEVPRVTFAAMGQEQSKRDRQGVGI